MVRRQQQDQPSSGGKSIEASLLRGDRFAVEDADEFLFHPDLSPRETEIARLVAKGLPNKTIAAVLEISPWTVSTHIRRMFGKLEVTSRAAMVARMMQFRATGGSRG